MFRFIRAGFILLLAIALSAGCESSGGGGGFEVSADNGERHALTEVGEILRNRMLDTTKPPLGQADIARYENAGPGGFGKVAKGEIVVIWGANPKDGAADQVLAYQKQTPQDGGFVLMLDGVTVKKLSPDEFKAAPKAGATAPTGAEKSK